MSGTSKTVVELSAVNKDTQTYTETDRNTNVIFLVFMPPPNLLGGGEYHYPINSQSA